MDKNKKIFGILFNYLYIVSYKFQKQITIRIIPL